MKITNRWGLPQPLVTAVTQSTHSKEGADFSVTELIRPPRIAALEIKHAAELEEDASDRIWALMGSMGHEVLRKASQGGIVEERCVIDIHGVKVSGQMDLAVPEKSIIDYKFVSLWAIREGVKSDWEQQLNCYKYLAEQYGVEVKELSIIAILRDWNVNEAKRNPELPQSQVVVLPVRIWEKALVENFLKSRIEAHVAARNGVLPECTSEEMWTRPLKFAIKKPGNKRASKLCDSYDEAIKLRAPNQIIEQRPEQRIRCENYCRVSSVCSQYAQFKEMLSLQGGKGEGDVSEE